MRPPEMVSAAAKGVASTLRDLSRFAKLERVLAGICVTTPLFLIAFDGWSVRESISAYFNMEENQVYYFPLTVAAMLFVVNGVVKEKLAYNTVLGLMLAGVILFDCQDWEVVHTGFAIAFFGGNGFVILKYSSKKERWFKAVLVLAMAVSLLGHFVFGWFSLFWAEWFSFGIIALHYILESWGVID